MSGGPGRPERAPLGSLEALAATEWPPWPTPELLETTPSTMLEVERRAMEGAPVGTTAGRGRRGRAWESSARAGLWWSLLLRPRVSADRLGWLPLVAGLGVARGILQSTGITVGLKWPNDVVVGDGKLAGILAERLADGAVVVGVGINVDQEGRDLPEGGTSLRMLRSEQARASVLVGVLSGVAGAYRAWHAGADPRGDYAAISATLGRDIRADLGDRTLEGRAVGLGASGELIVSLADGTERALSAGDVALVRPAS